MKKQHVLVPLLVALATVLGACSSGATSPQAGSSSQPPSSNPSGQDGSGSSSAPAASSAGPVAESSQAGIGGNGKSGAVAFLMPSHASPRFDQHDFPGFKAELAKVCAACTIINSNADGDPQKQQQQFDSALTQGAKVIVLNAVDTSAAVSLVAEAHAKGVFVVAYDRPIPNGKADFYTSYDNEKVGKLIATSLVDHLRSENVPATTGGVLEVNGSPTDAAAGLIKQGIHEGLATGDYKTLAEYDTPAWDPAKAQDWVSGQITRFPGKIVGVVAANDGTAGGTIAAFQAAGVKTVPPVTGNDATNTGLQYVISGLQYNTISKPPEIQGAAAADAAASFISGEKPKSNATVFDTPSMLFTPTVVTQQNIKKIIFDSGIAKPADICTADYKQACSKLGIQ